VRFLGTSSLVTASPDRTLKVWDLSTAPTIGEPQASIVSVDLSPDDRSIAVTDGTSSKLVTVATGTSKPLEESQLLTVNAVAFVDSGARVIEGGVDFDGAGAVVISDPRTGDETRLDLGSRSLPGVIGVDLSPRSNLLVVSLTGANAILFDLTDRAHPRRLGDLASGANASARFDRSGERVVTAGDRLAQVFDARTRKRISSFTHLGWVNGAVFSPDGSRVLTYGIDRTAYIWDAARSEHEVVALQGHSNWVRTGEFSPDGTRVVTSSQDGVVRVWDAKTGDMIGLERPHAGPVLASSFSSDGRELFTAGWDGALKLGACESCGSVAHLRELADERLTRGFTAAERKEFSIG
jgi:WD40 repeat protein